MKTLDQQKRRKIEKLAKKIFIALLHDDRDAKTNANAAISLATIFYNTVNPESK